MHVQSRSREEQEENEEEKVSRTGGAPYEASESENLVMLEL